MVNLKFRIDRREDIKTALIFRNSKKGGIDFSSIIYEEVPELKGINKKSEIIKIIKKEYEKRKNHIDKSKERYENIWKSFDFSKIENLMGRNAGNITACISIFNCNPKFIERRLFQIYYKLNNKEALQTITHELIHFIYFDIHKEIFKKDPLSKEKSWVLSEIIDEIIMKEFDLTGGLYPEHKRFFKKFQNLWTKYKQNGFKHFLIQAVKIAKKLDL